VALRTFAALRPGSELTADLARCDRLRPGELRLDARFRAMVELMPLGNRAEDFGVALGLLESGAVVESQADYDREHARWTPAELAAFHERFYRERAAFSEAEPERWLALMGPYPELLPQLRRVIDSTELAIATAKDRVTVHALLRAYAVDDLFPEEWILDKETGVDKTAHLRELQRRVGCNFEDVTFVDDKVSHLDSVAALGVRCALAAWGYNGAREARLARQRGYGVWSLDGFEQAIAGG
jgi:phosphoglycolate phosphatase-like HAD superfamily hydrolase